MFLKRIRLENPEAGNPLLLDRIAGGLTIVQNLDAPASERVTILCGAALRSVRNASLEPADDSYELHQQEELGALVWGISRAEFTALSATVASSEHAETLPRTGVSLLPSWFDTISPQQIFFPGAEDAGSFRDLARLCLRSDKSASQPVVSVTLQNALADIRRQRDGNGLNGGVVHQISALRRRQGRLQSELVALRATDERNTARLAELESEVNDANELRRHLEGELEQTRLRRVRCAALLALENSSSVMTTDILHSRSQSAAAWARIRDLVVQELQREVAAQVRESDAVTDLQREQIVQELDQQMQVLRQTLAAASPARESDQEMLHELQQGIQTLKLRIQPGQELRHSERSRRLRLMEHCLLDITELLAEPGVNPSQIGHHAAMGPVSRMQEESLLCEQASRSLLAELREAETELESALENLQQQHGRLAEAQDWIRSCIAPELTLERSDQLHASIAELDAEIELLREQRCRLDLAETALEERIRRSRCGVENSVLTKASEWLREITEGQYLSLNPAESETLTITPSSSEREIPLEQADPVVQDLCGLLLRLSLFQTWRAENVIMPLVLRDANLQPGDVWSERTAEILTTVAQTGQQIILLSDVAAEILPAAKLLEMTEDSASEDIAKISESEEHPATLEFPAPTPVEEETAPPSSETSPARQPGLLYYLSTEHRIEDLSGIRLAELEALRLTGVESIRQLLQITAEDLQQKVDVEGFSVSAARLQALRNQAELCVRVPMLRRGDAELLIASGVRSADQLKRLRPETLLDRISDFQRSAEGRRQRRFRRPIDRQQALNWARFGQEGRSLQSALCAGAADAPGIPQVTELRKRRRNTRAQRTVSTRPLPNTSKLSETRRRRQRKRHLQRRAAELRKNDAADVQAGEVAEQIGGMRFYLTPSSGIGSVPLIGPRTAAMLHDSGIMDVTDLLSLPPVRIVRRLRQSRITEGVVQNWQAQARLMCQIPELRGGPAQILVAAGVRSAESLSELQPEDLLQTLCRLKLPQRSGGGKSPKLPGIETVGEWIRWAANARSLKAA